MVIGDVTGADALVGLDRVVVTSQARRDGEVWLQVGTTEARSACRGCGVFGVGNERRHRVRCAGPRVGGAGAGHTHENDAGGEEQDGSPHDAPDVCPVAGKLVTTT